MICFGAETEKEWKKEHIDPTLKKNNKKNKINRSRKLRRRDGSFLFLFYFIFLSLLSSIYRNRTVRIRRDKKQNDVLDEGYVWEQKTRDFAEFLIKIWKILCFDFSQIYGFLQVRIGRSRRSN